MITYKIDKQSHAQTNTQIRDMTAVLAEISPTLQRLQELMDQQSTTISSPSINFFRSELQRKVAEAIEQTQSISDDAQKLISVSDQAGKHLAAIEEHFGAVLRSKTPVQTAETVQQVQ